MNRKIVALLAAILTVGTSILAECYRDRNGYRHCDDARVIVQEPENVVKRTGLFVGDIFSDGRASESYESRQEREREEQEQRELRKERYND